MVPSMPLAFGSQVCTGQPAKPGCPVNGSAAPNVTVACTPRTRFTPVADGGVGAGAPVGLQVAVAPALVRVRVAAVTCSCAGPIVIPVNMGAANVPEAFQVPTVMVVISIGAVTATVSVWPLMTTEPFTAMPIFTWEVSQVWFAVQPLVMVAVMFDTVMEGTFTPVTSAPVTSTTTWASPPVAVGVAVIVPVRFDTDTPVVPICHGFVPATFIVQLFCPV